MRSFKSDEVSAANLMLAARALGYGTVFYTDPIPDEVTRLTLQIPERYEWVCITPIGVPSEWSKAPAKKELPKRQWKVMALKLKLPHHLSNTP